MKTNYTNIYFLGIGGIGMSALAKFFNSHKYKVSGYDRVRNDNCLRLEEMGIAIHYDDNVENIPQEFKNNENTLVIYTPAIPQNNKEFLFFKNNGFEISKRSKVLGLISNSKNGLAIAGTHGKTSISGIATNIMSKSEFGCSAFLGGILKNIDSNIIINNESNCYIVEADEYDRSFLQLTPSTALVSCIEADHLDIYNNYDNLLDAFILFLNQTKSGGNIILNDNVDDKVKKSIRADVNLFYYSLDNENTDFFISDLSYNTGFCNFSINHRGQIIKDINYKIGGNYNLENVVAATAISLLNGASEDDVRQGLQTFKGIYRRFDIQVENQKNIYIDDYAHHPGEITAFLSAVRLLYPNKKITAIFQPHLYTRTRDFYKEFAESLSLADELILLPIYPAREEEIIGVNSELILNNVKLKDKNIVEKSELIETIKLSNPELLLTIGAGDIDAFVKPITKLLLK